MGVHGLTSFLRENKTALAHVLEFPPPRLSPWGGKTSTALVVDGWSFIYELLHCADLPWVYGGEYDAFARLIERVATGWIAVGLHLHFVFDGPYPALKFPTLVSRVTQTSIHGGLLFFRTSPSARATPRFLHETQILPPLTYTVCVQTLLRLASAPDVPLEVHFADEEGDPYAVALAGRLHAYVAGKDSDFVVLNVDGYKGYMPLDEMVWNTLTSSSSASETSSLYSSLNGDGDEEEDEYGFKKVRKAKSRKRAAANHRVGRGLIPPDTTIEPDGELTLSCTVYTPDDLASHLQLPVSVLSLVGALVGNDYTGQPDESAPSSRRKSNLHRLFFERQLTLVQRIVRVATTLRSILSSAFSSGGAPAPKRKQKEIGSVMELIDAAVTALLIRPLDTLATGELEDIVDRIAEATLQYAIPRQDELEVSTAHNGRLQWASDVCALHDHESCPLFALLSRLDICAYHDSAETLVRVAASYVAAYRAGNLNPHVLNSISTGTAWPKVFLEDPDKETVARSIGRPIREAGYAILGAGSVPAQSTDNEDPEDEYDSGDELIDVVEESDDDDDDPLAPLRGALEQLGDGQKQDNGQARTGQTAPPSAKETLPRIVTECVRRGTHLSAEDVSVPALHDIMKTLSLPQPQHDGQHAQVPVQLWPLDARRVFLLRILQSDVPSIKAVSDDKLIAVLAVRWVVRCMHARAAESDGNKEREKERWTQVEARTFLNAFAWSPSGEAADTAPEELPVEPVQIIERNVQLVAQLTMALDTIEQLAQILLLGDVIPTPAALFSGRRFHANLVRLGNDSMADSSNALWRACLEGLEHAFAGRGPKAKKDRKKEARAPITSPAKVQPGQGQPRRGGMYDILAQLDG
ncbi:hypothetical protein POSPLADRAFT_1181919 [Postia placenta MAD-698-R-SB12]|uniref:Asteroid domain-containing protein n=1 Tax=Postia placenta MAD-698-R-SB12 TaxID=670580 RepID=A0A1X6MZS1_9APHY|nr:hypothetical protein POSPLADRAFT_1181919 [Postia placenta MAD-698-R-SB12]OSX61868.1 hypothetical protein POSPLADRAFT_1181919 [Postia placenta MAD-698-R-SB12]